MAHISKNVPTPVLDASGGDTVVVLGGSVVALDACSVVMGSSEVVSRGHSPVAVDVQQDMRGADSQCQPVPLLVGQAVGKDLGVGLLAPTLVVQPQLAALPAALQLQEPARRQTAVQSQPAKQELTLVHTNTDTGLRLL